jgi:hypothetical protein
MTTMREKTVSFFTYFLLILKTETTTNLMKVDSRFSKKLILIESEEIVNEVWEIVGSDYDKNAILDALDEVDWDIEGAVNLILSGWSL